MQHFHMDHPAAAHRLALGIPATIEHGGNETTGPASQGVGAQIVAETTQNFITLMDALKLQMRAKDQLHPLLSDVLSAYTKAGTNSGESREKLLEWCVGTCSCSMCGDRLTHHIQAHSVKSTQCE